MMNVLSVNIGKPETIEVKGRKELTGYFKKPVSHPIFLTAGGVQNDTTVDRRHHGGKNKACYLYSYAHYPYWKKLYPELDFSYGMFGENITVSEMNEARLKIGDVLQTGESVIQITQPRQPCYKMGIRFNNSAVVNQFRNAPYPGIYVRVLQEGRVKVNDTISLLKTSNEAPTVLHVFELLRSTSTPRKIIESIINGEFSAADVSRYLKTKLFSDTDK